MTLLFVAHRCSESHSESGRCLLVFVIQLGRFVIVMQ